MDALCKLEQFPVRRLSGSDNNLVVYIRRDADQDIELFIELLLYPVYCNIPAFHCFFVQVYYKLHLGKVSGNVSDMVYFGCFNLPCKGSCLFPVVSIVFRVFFGKGNCHHRSARNLPCIHDFNQTRKTQGNVNLSHTGVVEGTHRHLSARFSY
ncbi:hypothetical protein DSECCO2_596060 [anaerobic digester metagenome]